MSTELAESLRCPRSFVRALWGLDVNLLPVPATTELQPRRPRFLGSTVWLPNSALRGVPGNFSDYLLAAAAHTAAHQSFGFAGARFVVGSLKPAQVAIISLLEDARVERLARECYPGLAQLWTPYHDAESRGAKTSGALLARLARALHDDHFRDDDGWVTKARESFFADRSAWSDPTFVRSLGGRLGNDLGQMRVPFNARDYLVQPAYRDDNTGLWQFEQESSADDMALELEAARRRESSSPAGAEPEAQGVSAAANAEASADLEPPLALRVQPAAALEAAARYPEWDYVIGRDRTAFCSLWEKPTPASDATHLGAPLARHAPAQRRLERAALRLKSDRPIRLRRLRDGNRLDLTAVLASVVARESGMRPDPRVYCQVSFQPEPPAVLVLLDCSESLNAVPKGASASILEQARCASALLAQTIDNITRDFAIHGFSSNGRHEVGYFRFKDFDQPYDEPARRRLAGMRAGLSTRLGGALRHAGRALSARTARRKFLLVVSDGEPSDVDVHDPNYLLLDAKRATQENRARGVMSFCLGLDSTAVSSVRCIFGNGNYVLTDRPEQLPELLARFYLRVTG